jgi:hypothetical protein
MNVLVFKTNIEDTKQVKYLSLHLKLIDGILTWNVDLHDCDKVLRIEADKLHPNTVVNVLNSAGYFCAELQD